MDSEAEDRLARLIERDATGRSWLPSLLGAAPEAPRRFGELVEQSGTLAMSLSVRGIDGRLGCFTFPTRPSRRLLAWFIEHPEALSWPADAGLSAPAERLCRMLVYDDPPGSRPAARERAHELLATRSVLSQEWWRFEASAYLEGALITERLVVGLVTGDPRSSTTPWYPARSRLVRDLETVRDIADGLPYGVLALRAPGSAGTALDAEQVARLVSDGAPHLDAGEQAELADGYLGELAWSQVPAAA